MSALESLRQFVLYEKVGYATSPGPINYSAPSNLIPPTKTWNPIYDDYQPGVRSGSNRGDVYRPTAITKET